MKPQFSVIIPNYNGAGFLPECLQSLTAAIKNYPTDYEIILVDNGSVDSSLEVFNDNIMPSDKPQSINTKICLLKENWGFAKAVNTGIKSSKYSWVVLLNNDLTLKPDWFSLIGNEIEKNPPENLAAFCGTVLNKLGDQIESQGLQFFIKGKCLNINNRQTFDPKKIPAQPELIWGSPAALVVYKKEIIEKIGLFDEKFFAYEEDVDISLRLHRLGYLTLYIPGTLSNHLGGGTSNKMGNFRNRMDAKNWLYIIVKNYTLSDILNNFYSIFIERLRNLSGLVKETVKKDKLKSLYSVPLSLIMVYGTVFINFPDMLRKRKQLQFLLQSKQ